MRGAAGFGREKGRGNEPVGRGSGEVGQERGGHCGEPQHGRQTCPDGLSSERRDPRIAPSARAARRTPMTLVQTVKLDPNHGARSRTAESSTLITHAPPAKAATHQGSDLRGIASLRAR